MHHAEPARRTRSEDLRAFADAFSEADDAFGPGPTSRTLTLAELGDALNLDGAAVLDGLAGDRPEPGSRAAEPEATPEVPDFDFGSRAVERARRRTAARLDASPSVPRRTSGPSARFVRSQDDASRSDAGADLHAAEIAEEVSASFGSPDTRPAHLTLAPAAYVEPVGAPALPREADPFASDPDARAVVQITGRPGHVALPPRSRERAAERRRRSPGERMAASPDRIALWAVLLGIFLVVVAAASSRADAAERTPGAPAANVLQVAPATPPALPAGLRATR